MVERLPHGAATSSTSCPRSSSASCPSSPIGAASSGTRWAATARSCWRCAIPSAIAASRRSRRSRAPMQVPWGEKAFSGYLGTDRARWAEHDASALVRTAALPGHAPRRPGHRRQVPRRRSFVPSSSPAPARKSGQPLALRMREGYDHCYYFISTFVEPSTCGTTPPRSVRRDCDEQERLGSGVRRVQGRRRPHDSSARLRRDAHHRQGHLGRPGRRARRARHPARVARARRQLHRHRRLLRALRERGAHPRGAPSVQRAPRRVPRAASRASGRTCGRRSGGPSICASACS